MMLTPSRLAKALEEIPADINLTPRQADLIHQAAQNIRCLQQHTGALPRDRMISALADKFEHRPSHGTVEYATECIDAVLAALDP